MDHDDVQDSSNIDIQLSQAANLINTQLANSNNKTIDFNLKSKTANADQVIKIIFNILHQRQKDLTSKEELYQENLELEKITSSLEATNAKLKSKTLAKDRELDQLKLKLTAADDSLSKYKASTQSLKDELKSVKSNAAMEKTNFLHETRKKERDTEKLRVKLSKLMTTQAQSSKISINILNPTTPNSKTHPSKPGTPNKKKVNSNAEENDFYVGIIKKSEEREKDLLIENENLKSFLKDVYFMVLGIDKSSTTDEVIHESTVSRFQLPFNHIKEFLDQDFKAKILELSEKLSSTNSTCTKLSKEQEMNLNKQEILTDLNNENRILKTQIEELNEIIKEQNRLLEMSMDAEYYVPSNDTEVDHEEENNFYELTTIELNKQFQQVEQKKLCLDDERKRFTESCIRLGIEVSNFEKEKEEFNKRVRNEFDRIRVKEYQPLSDRNTQYNASPPKIYNQQTPVKLTNKSIPPSTSKKSVSFTPSLEKIIPPQDDEYSMESSIYNPNGNNEMDTLTTPMNVKSGTFVINKENFIDESISPSPPQTVKNTNKIVHTSTPIIYTTPIKKSIIGTPRTRKIDNKNIFYSPMSERKVALLQERMKELQAKKTPLRSRN